MTPLAISAIAFVLIFGGAVLGMVLRALLPDAHLSDNSKDVVRLSMGLIATIAALVLGLLIASAKTSYDGKNAKIKQMTVDIIMIDSFLDEYGPQALPARRLLRAAMATSIERIWNESDPAHRVPFEASPQSRALYNALLSLKPENDIQRSIHARLIALSTDLAETRLALFTQAGHAIATPFLAILVFWLAMIFASFSLFVRTEPVVIVALLVCSLSAACALFLILEMDRPFSGVMAIASEPLRNALAPLAQ